MKQAKKPILHAFGIFVYLLASTMLPTKIMAYDGTDELVNIHPQSLLAKEFFVEFDQFGSNLIIQEVTVTLGKGGNTKVTYNNQTKSFTGLPNATEFNENTDKIKAIAKKLGEWLDMRNQFIIESINNRKIELVLAVINACNTRHQNRSKFLSQRDEKVESALNNTAIATFEHQITADLAQRAASLEPLINRDFNSQDKDSWKFLAAAVLPEQEYPEDVKIALATQEEMANSFFAAFSGLLFSNMQFDESKKDLKTVTAVAATNPLFNDAFRSEYLLLTHALQEFFLDNEDYQAKHNQTKENLKNAIKKASAWKDKKGAEIASSFIPLPVTSNVKDPAQDEDQGPSSSSAETQDAQAEAPATPATPAPQALPTPAAVTATTVKGPATPTAVTETKVEAPVKSVSNPVKKDPSKNKNKRKKNRGISK